MASKLPAPLGMPAIVPRRVLVISYPFLPLYDVGVKRVAKLCKYLPDCGWRAVVLTKDWERQTAAEDGQIFPLFREAERIDEIAEKIDVVRAPYHTHENAVTRLRDRLSDVVNSGPRSIAPLALGARKALSSTYPLWGAFPDAFIGWIPGAIEAGASAIGQYHVDAILSLCPPPTAHIVASELARRTGVPWVAQFDDLFSFHLEKHRPQWRAYARRRHQHWLAPAAAVGAITPGMLNYLERTYDKSGDVVMVGFDPEESAMESTDRTSRSHRDRFRIVYTGSIYLGDHRPDVFLAGLDLLLSQVPNAEKELEVLFVGTRREEDLKAMLTERTARVCRIRSRVPASESLRLQRGADLLLLFNFTDPDARSATLSYPAKSFEYLASGRPILAVPSDPGGWGNEMLHRTGAGWTADDAIGVATRIESLLKEWRATGSIAYAGRQNFIQEYGQPAQAARLAGLLDGALNRAQADCGIHGRRVHA